MSNKINKKISSSTFKSLVANESVKLSNVDRETIVKTLNNISEKNRGFVFSVSKKSGEYVVTRLVPETRHDKALYAASISKKTFNKILKANNFDKTKTAETLGLCQRTIYRLIERNS